MPVPVHLPTPAVGWCVAAIGGALVGWEYATVRSALPVAVGAAVVGLVGLAVLRRRPVPSLLAIALALAGLAGAHRALLDGGPVDRLARDGGAAQLVGVVATEPRLGDGDRWWAVVRMATLDAAGTRERVLLRGDDAPPVLGTTLAFRATARPLDDDGFGAWLRRQHVVAQVDPAGPVEARAPPGRLLASTEHVRARVRTAASTGLGGDRAGLAVGLVTGDTRLLSPAAEDAMQAVGLTHLVAVSGSNVAVVVGGLLLVAGLAGLGARGRRLLLVAGVAWFVVLTRAEPSVLRAAVMAGVVLVARARGVGSQPTHALAVAVLALVAVDPALAGSIGLLLSAAATAGVLVVAPLVARRLHRWPRPVAVAVSVTVGAQVAVSPVLLVTTGTVPLASVPANLVAVPAAAVASVVAGVASVVAVVHVGAAGLLMACADPPLRVVLGATAVPDLPVLSWARPALVVVGAGVVAWLLARRRSRPARVGAGVAVLAALALVPVAWSVPAVLTVTAIDVGQGDAVLVEGGGARVLVDAGPDEDHVADWLRRRGIGALDLVVLSHPHADHAAGVPAVLAATDVSALWLRPVASEAATGDRLRAAARAADVPVVEPVAGQWARVGALTVHVLAPPRGPPFGGSDGGANDMSLVLRIDHGGRRALLTGDVEEAAQQWLLRAPAALRAGLLKVPHHGGATSDPAFLRAVGARVALVSAGRDNRYGHPAAEVLDVLAAAGAEVRRTDHEGTITVPVPAGRPARSDAVPPVRGGADRAWHAATAVCPCRPASPTHAPSDAGRESRCANGPWSRSSRILPAPCPRRLRVSTSFGGSGGTSWGMRP